MNTLSSFIVVLAVVSQGEGMTAQEFVSEGMKLFVAGDVAGSLVRFDKAAEIDKEIVPGLWQRGISHYYLGKFKEGRKQFEIHKTVNPHDVENATWHYICVARLEGVEVARKAIIGIDTDRDTRVPLKQVYELYAGVGSVEQVMAAAEKSGGASAEMYAHLYVGLYYEAAGKTELAKRHLTKAASIDLPGHYMRDVAKVHVKQRGWLPEDAK